MADNLENNSGKKKFIWDGLTDTCLVNSVVGVDTPKFSSVTLKRYCSFGINKPCVDADASLASGTVIFESVEIAIMFYSCYKYLSFKSPVFQGLFL